VARVPRYFAVPRSHERRNAAARRRFVSIAIQGHQLVGHPQSVVEAERNALQHIANGDAEKQRGNRAGDEQAEVPATSRASG
jgi:hypothetical protein